MNEFEFPSSFWAMTALGDLSEVKSGVGFPKKYQGQSSGDYPVYKVGDVSRSVTQAQGLLGSANHYVNTEEAAALKGVIFRSGSTLFAKIGEAVKLNRRAFVTLPGLADNNVMAVVPLLRESDRYLHYFLRTVDLSDVSRSTTVPSVRKGDIEELLVPLPPLAEQKAIAEKLDTLLAQVESTKGRLERIPKILKRFRQSVLAAAVSGKLTEEWRQQFGSKSGEEVVHSDSVAKEALCSDSPALKKKKSSLQSMLDEEYCYEIPRSWVFSTWGKVSEWITYGFTKPMPKASEGVKLLTAKDVVRFSVDIGSAGFTSEVAYSGLSDKDRPKKGDLLITKDGSIGRAALVRVDNPFCINQSVAVCWLRSTRMNKDYLEIVANADFTQRFVQDKAQGMAIQHLSIIDFAKCPLPVPPLEEQNEIVRRVDQLFAYADTIETQVNNALERVNNLTQSILAKAFRGELTEQWRKDNPDLISGENSAEALLEKIKAERAAAKPVKRGRRKA